MRPNQTRRGPTRQLTWQAALALVIGVAVASIVLHALGARAASIAQLRQRIDAGQSKISVLSGEISAAGGRVARLGSSISRLQQQIARIQADLDAKRSTLLKLRRGLDAARTRLAQLEAYEAYAERVLARQLVSTYEADRPDVVHVVLDATGFQDLLERLSFMQRVQRQDTHVVAQVRAARRAVAAQATRLGALELRQQTLTEAVLQQRNNLASTRVSMVRQQLMAARARNRKTGQLARVRGRMSTLRRQLSAAEAAQAAAAARAAAAAAASQQSVGSGGHGSGPGWTGSPGGAPAPASRGGFVFPLPKDAASPPTSWSPDDGVDISAPGDTPEYAVCSGTVVLHGIGGFGPWAPVLHCDGPIDGFSYVYYGHAGPASQLPVGTHVGAGQVISSVGPGVVGISTGPHLEIGFCDSAGSPIGPQTSVTMLSLLRAAYG